MRLQILAGVLLLVIGIFVGYKLAPKASTTDVKQNNNVVTHETTTTVTGRDGTVKTVIVRDVVDRTKIEKEFVIVPRAKVLNLSGLIAIDTTERLLKPVYGLSVSKEVFGPFTAGAFGLTNGLVGVSIGINF